MLVGKQCGRTLQRKAKIAFLRDVTSLSFLPFYVMLSSKMFCLIRVFGCGGPIFFESDLNDEIRPLRFSTCYAPMLSLTLFFCPSASHALQKGVFVSSDYLATQGPLKVTSKMKCGHSDSLNIIPRSPSDHEATLWLGAV